jgi:hypothetical protein
MWKKSRRPARSRSDNWLLDQAINFSNALKRIIFCCCDAMAAVPPTILRRSVAP